MVGDRVLECVTSCVVGLAGRARDTSSRGEYNKEIKIGRKKLIEIASATDLGASRGSPVVEGHILKDSVLKIISLS